MASNTVEMNKIIYFCVLMVLCSCSIVTVLPESLVDNKLSCEKPISKSVALIWVVGKSTRDMQLEKKALTDPLSQQIEEKLTESKCFEKVSTFIDDSQVKDVDRIIRIRITSQSRSNWEMTGRTLWAFVSASTLFLLPYYDTEINEMTLDDSKTGRSISYEFKTKYSAHIIYFFEDWVLTAEAQKRYEIIFEFIKELKAKP